MALRAEDVYAILKKKIELGGATPEQIQQAVENYLDENPVETGELSVKDHVITIGGQGL